jgi:anthranilate synthase component 1
MADKYKEVQFSPMLFICFQSPDTYMKKPAPCRCRRYFSGRTLSGAQNIEQLSSKNTKKTNRNFYGGAMGFMDFEGNFAPL